MYVIYINDRKGNKITQIFDAYNIDIKKKLNDVSNASFCVITNENCKYEYFKEYNKIKIYKFEKGIEKLMFSGICRGAETHIDEAKITLSNELFLLKKKVLYSEKNYNTTIKGILEDLINDVNSRDSGFMSLECDVETENISKQFKSKRNYFEILKDLAGDTYEFDYRDGVLIFKNTIGKDRSDGSEIVSWEYNYADQRGRNVIDASCDYDGDKIANAVLGEDGNKEDAESIEKFGRIEEGFSSGLRDNLLAEKKNSLKEVDISPMDNDYFTCDIGDVVKVYIDSGSDLLYYNGNLKVVEKTFKSGMLPNTTYKLSTNKMAPKNLLETIGDLKDRVSNLEK